MWILGNHELVLLYDPQIQTTTLTCRINMKCDVGFVETFVDFVVLY